MRFGPNVVEHAPFSIPMIGNTETGYVIGLTPEGAAVCHRMFTEDVPEAEVAAVHADLPAHLRRGGFVVEGESADGVAVREGAEGVDEGALGKGVEDAERPEDVEREESVEGAGDAESAAAEGANMAAFDSPVPLQSAYLHVTHHCNLNCIGCYSAVDARNARRDLTLDELRGIIDALADAGCQHLVISGGEPFLRDDLAAIVAYVRERGIDSVDVLTNGTAVTPEKLAAIAPYVGRVSVSFDGPNAEAAPGHSPRAAVRPLGGGGGDDPRGGHCAPHHSDGPCGQHRRFGRVRGFGRLAGGHHELQPAVRIRGKR